MSFNWFANAAAGSGFETAIACVFAGMIAVAVTVYVTVIVAIIREG